MSEELTPGMRMGRYRLLFRLGKGGMGEVWASSQGQADLGFQKTVALKVLRTQEMTSNAVKMFFDEANAASALDHAAIVPTLDLGQDGPSFYIAMPLVEGPSLTALLQRLVIRKKHMPPSVVAYIGLRLASALDFAHTRATLGGHTLELVHRDVSPHNVLLDLNGSVRLTDFGVARTTVQSHESHVGTVRGKPSYMAPEQVVGADIDARTDLFALGIVLYESACLKRLFGRSNPVKSMDAVVNHTPRPLISLVPDFPEKLWKVIERVLEKTPAKRFESARALYEALEEASRDIEGMTTAPQDLAKLIEQSFERDAFSLTERVREAMASLDQVEVGPASLTAAGRRPRVDLPYHSDPLAPEAIQEIEHHTQFLNLTPSSAGAAMTSSASMDSMTPPAVSGTHRSLTLNAASGRRGRNTASAVALAVAAIVLLGTTVLVVRSGAEQPAAALVQTAEPAARTAPGAVQNKKEVPKAPPPVVAPPVTRVEPPPVEEPPAKRPRRTVRVPTEKAPDPEVAPAKADATYEEVKGLINRVRTMDAAKGGRMFATLIEAGRTNTEKLNELRQEAQSLLKPKE